jgi:hypothetical protein
LVLALWDEEKRCPHPARPIQNVLDEVYGHDNEATEEAFRQLCSDTRSKLEEANLPLTIENLQGTTRLIQRPA